MAIPSPNDWRVPPVEATEDVKVAWLGARIDEATTFLKAQRSSQDKAKAIEFIAGEETEDLPDSYSRVSVNRGKRQIREFVATFSNMRPIAGFTTDDSELTAQVEVQNKMRMGWYYDTSADRSYRHMYQVGGVVGKAYLRPWWDPDFHGDGRGDIALDVHDVEDVLPIQVGEDNDLQKAYGVAIRMRKPLAQVLEMFPTKEHLIVADREAPTGFRRIVGKIKQQFASPALNVRGTGRDGRSEPAIFPEVDLYLVYIRDRAVNMTDHVIPMGEPGTTGYYEVPPFNSDIPTGIFNEQRQELFRKATRDDALLYPRLRVWWATNNHILSDGPNSSWCPKVPLVPFQTDDWYWEFWGYSLTRDIRPMQECVKRILRAVDDSTNAGLSPGLGYDDQTVSKELVDEFDPRVPGQTIGLNMSMGEGIKPLLPHDYYKVQPEAFALVDKLHQWMDYQLGTPEIAALSRVKQMPASDSIEKILEAGGPLIMDIARNIERAQREEGEIWKYLSFQHYDTKRKVSQLGDKGLLEADYDYDPGNAIPSHMPGEDPAKLSRYNIYSRAKFYMGRMRYRIKESSILQIKQMSRRLFLLQLQKIGFPIDPWSIAEACDLDIGPSPQGANTMMERWVAWQHLQAEIKLDIQKQLQAAGVGGGGGEGGGGRGRPNSNARPGRMASKDGGTRSSAVTS